jgi:serine/threonine-protein kinase RsbW
VITRPPKILVIKSDVSELKKVEYFLIDIFNENGFDQKYFNKIYLCISEAVVNAIKHGNRNDLKKNVFIAVNCTLQDISVQIEDEGNGFDLNNVKDPTTKENLNNESGRGIFIIRKLSNKIEYNEKGNRIQFKIECK